ncbi:unnamed protein product [Oikopleura dioica]|uniref:Uncharacterized protein n=1 Tax=Oikopleura dioica TaxID=34765 RepID=E4X2T1_OIKDI|nr:unnamed protein product [Oikopleura dioica]
MTFADCRRNWRRCRFFMWLAIVMVVISIPFFIVFGIEFINGKADWESNEKDIIPGDIFLYGALVFLNFGWVFFVVYYSMTLTAKEYDENLLDSNNRRRKSVLQVRASMATGPLFRRPTTMELRSLLPPVTESI